jgi:hypothetical protein
LVVGGVIAPDLPVRGLTIRTRGRVIRLISSAKAEQAQRCSNRGARYGLHGRSGVFCASFPTHCSHSSNARFFAQFVAALRISQEARQFTTINASLAHDAKFTCASTPLRQCRLARCAVIAEHLDAYSWCASNNHRNAAFI